MTTLYLDIFSGVSGDMFIGALVDLSVDPASLEAELRKLGLDGYHLHFGRRQKLGITGVKFDVHLEQDHDHSHPHEHSHSRGHSHPHSHEHGHPHSHEHGRTYAEIRRLIEVSALSGWVKGKALGVFHRIAVAEGSIHGVPVEQVGFHEVGAVDSIVDIVGACIALEMLGKPQVLASHVVEGMGFVKCAHGSYPIPAPATLAILAARQIPLTQCDEPHELVTPTGAALLSEFVERFGPMRSFAAGRVGFGIGSRDNLTRPNVLRALLGEQTQVSESAGWETDTVAVLESNLDDASPEILGAFFEKALVRGALDVFYTPIQMKKNRPGTLLTVLCTQEQGDTFCELILQETSAFGVRRHDVERRKLSREFSVVETPFGRVQIKHGKLNGRVVQSAPEFESCKAAAENAGAPLKRVYEAAIAALKPSA